MKLIAGPCVIESERHVRFMADRLQSITDKFDVDFYFKASYDKANRTKLDSFRGPGFRKGIDILRKLRDDTGLQTTTDFHDVWEIQQGGHWVSLIQIPAFLCRQTDLLVAAGLKNRPVNIKKGQFMSAAGMAAANIKVGHGNVWITERGTTYGSDLRVDFDKIPQISSFAAVTIMDCTHSSQDGNQVLMAKLGLTAGADGIFMEVHDDPPSAGCDGAKSVKLSDFASILTELTELWQFIHKE